MSDATNILDLPTDPVGGGSVGGNVTMTIQDPAPNVNPSTSKLDESTINQIVSGIQRATMSGSTQLPSRDIPINTSGLTNDPQTMPNYVPPLPPAPQDYIKNYEQTSDMIHQYNKGRQINNSLDDMYNEIQTPLLLAVLYFLFQLPFFKRFLYTYIPFLFSNDGNYNINGFLFTSAIFGMIFHFLMKSTSCFGAF